MLTDKGYSEISTESSWQAVWSDSCEHIVDLHWFEYKDVNTLLFEDIEFPVNIFDGRGKIGGLDVICLTAEAQVLYHQGYEHKEKDIQDVLLLCKIFGFPIPDQFKAV